MSRIVAAVIFVVCVGAAVENTQLHITHGATTAFIVGAVLAFFSAVHTDDISEEKLAQLEARVQQLEQEARSIR